MPGVDQKDANYLCSDVKRTGHRFMKVFSMQGYQASISPSNSWRWGVGGMEDGGVDISSLFVMIGEMEDGNLVVHQG